MKRTFAVAVVAVLFACSALAQEAPAPFTNADVIRLLAAHSAEAQVLAAIGDAKAPTFDFSEKAVRELGTAGASLSIISAMRKANAAAAASTPAAPAQAAPAAAQTLAGASEEARKAGHSWEVSTNNGPTAPTTPASTRAAPATKSDAAAKGEDYWRKRMTDLRSALARDSGTCEAVAKQITDLQAELAAFPETYGKAANVDKPAKTALNRRLATAKQEKGKCDVRVSQDQRAIDAAEEEARAKGVVPGWLRPKQ
jgi:hypothetical protein